MTSKWYRDRGKKLETIINALLENENLEPRTSFRPEGEEIDGSFFAFNKFFLLEMKWHKSEIPASAIYAFKGKVDGKLTGTIGVFISMSGYSKDAVDALCLGKELNIILFDKEDIDEAFNTSFSNVLKKKLRAAADYEDVYKSKELPVISKKTNVAEETNSTLKDSVITNVSSDNMRYCILCEGRFELTVLQELLMRLMTQYFITNKICIKQTGGHYNLLNATNDCENYDKIIIVTEVDDSVITECKKKR
ncbi:restriction endonuclease [Treponema sp.]|uniref:restriction endonuclease n=1 Tax=Treponema sp. TaxID=166 RepID=UPI003FD8ACCF